MKDLGEAETILGIRIFSTALVGVLFSRNVAVSRAKPQKDVGRLA